MNRRIALREYTPSIMILGRADVLELQSSLGSKISISRTVQPGEYEVNPQSYVGVVRLASGLILDLLPKVPLYNVMWMISEVEKLDGINFDLLDRQVPAKTFDDILEPIASAFADQVEHLVDRGLYRSYIEREDNLTAIRGRIDFREDLNHNVVLRHRTYCRFTEYSWDVPENQVVRQVVRQLVSWGFSAKLTSRLMALDRQMEDISLGNLRPSDIDRFNYSRQSEHYRPIHRFCRLFLDGLSLSELEGATPLDGFVMNMNVLFERFVAQKLDHELRRLTPNWRLASQSTSPLFWSRGNRIKPDILLQQSGKNILVADTKYYRVTGADIDPGAYYQMITYCMVLGLDTAVLIYPRDISDVRENLRVVNSAIKIYEYSIDLHAHRDLIDIEFGELASRLISPEPLLFTI